MQKARSHPSRQTNLPRKILPLVGTRCQGLFHSPPGVLLTFLSLYSCTIGLGLLFSLGGWSPQIQPELLGSSGLLRYSGHTINDRFAYRTLTLCGGPFQAASAHVVAYAKQVPPEPYNPVPI